MPVPGADRGWHRVAIAGLVTPVNVRMTHRDTSVRVQHNNGVSEYVEHSLEIVIERETSEASSTVTVLSDLILS